MVSELALESLSEQFGADGVMLVRKGRDESLAAVSSRVPPSWSIGEPLGFEVSGRLWAALDGPDGDASTSVGSSHLLVTCQSTVASVVAAAVLRSEPFTPDEMRVIGRLIRSVALALEDAAPLPESGSLRVLSRTAENGFLADVRLTFRESQRLGAAVAASDGRAIAQAAVELCDLALRVRFVGSTSMRGSVVTLVVVDEPDGGPFFGLSVTEPSSSTGAAEAVFAAAAVIGANPYSVECRNDSVGSQS